MSHSTTSEQHRDLHEGNLCIRQVRPPTTKQDPSSPIQFGFSGLEITILDYGLSRATAPTPKPADGTAASTATPPSPRIVAYDLEKDLSLFTSTHAPQCRVYRQMRSYLLCGDRVHLPPRHHRTPYAPSTLLTLEEDDGNDDDGDEDNNNNNNNNKSKNKSNKKPVPISWRGHHPYTNVLWLAYLYGYLTTTAARHFASGGSSSSKDEAREKQKQLARFRRETAELRAHLDPAAPRDVPAFPSAGAVVRFAVEAGWVSEAQLAG